MGRLAAGLMVCAALSACLGPLTLKSSDRPRLRPDLLQPVPAATYTPSAEAQALMRFYAGLQQDLLTRGLLRADGGAVDTPYDAEDLARAFEAIAFFDEYGDVDAPGAGGLARWDAPVVLTPVFAPSVPDAQRRRDEAELERYAKRLARLTGHPVRTGSGGNFTVIFAGVDDAEFVSAKVKRLLPNLSAADLDLFVHPPRQFYCLVTAGGNQSAPLIYTRGVALIRAEQPDLMREACIHEEVAQGLGLRNDSPRARPSIFNDDDEFARLTSHDEKLLTMLYDPRLSTGISPQEARATVAQLAREQMSRAAPRAAPQAGHREPEQEPAPTFALLNGGQNGF